MAAKRKGVPLIEAFPDIAAQWHPTKNAGAEVEEVSRATPKKYWWQCFQEHEWVASVANRTRQNQGCPYCAGKRVLVGFNDLATLRPDVAAQWHPTKNLGLTPQDVTSKSRKKVHWVCPQGHESFLVVAEMTRQGRKCAYCSGRKIISGENDLLTKYPDLAAQCVTPEERVLSPGSRKLVSWQCAFGHDAWLSTVKDRVRGHGCPSCSGRVVIVGVNDLATKCPDLVNQWMTANDLKPTEVKYGSHYKAEWVCQEKHTWTATVYSRAITGNGCPVCTASVGEQEVYEYIVSLLGVDKVIHHDHSLLGRKELDIYIPSKKLAIEYNGLYWHSEAKVEKDYHYAKWEACEAQDVQLLHIWEDDWKYRRDIVKHMLAHKLGTSTLPRLHARQTHIREVPLDEARDFLDAHHIQGFVAGSFSWGLYDQSDLTAILVAKWTNQSRTELSILRYATSAQVRGGFTKLITYGERNTDVPSWVTFSDNGVSDGNLYANNGFKADRYLPPDYQYIVNQQRVHKFNYRLARFKNDPALLWEEGMTERELAGLNGLYRIWDSGKVRYTKIVQQPPQ